MCCFHSAIFAIFWQTSERQQQQNNTHNIHAHKNNNTIMIVSLAHTPHAIWLEATVNNIQMQRHRHAIPRNTQRWIRTSTIVIECQFLIFVRYDLGNGHRFSLIFYRIVIIFQRYWKIDREQNSPQEKRKRFSIAHSFVCCANLSSHFLHLFDDSEVYRWHESVEHISVRV